MYAYTYRSRRAPYQLYTDIYKYCRDGPPAAYRYLKTTDGPHWLYTYFGLHAGQATLAVQICVGVEVGHTY
jgi:hypothetical protein